MGGAVTCTPAYRCPLLSQRNRRFLLLSPLGAFASRTMLGLQKQMFAYRQTRSVLGYRSGLRGDDPLS